MPASRSRVRSCLACLFICLKYLPDVVILALLKREGEVEIDANHHRKWKGKSYMATDAAAFYEWKAKEFPALIEKLKAFKC